MLSSLILQLMIDLLLVAVIARMYLQQKKNLPHATPQIPSQTIEGWEAKWKEMEKEVFHLREQLKSDFEKTRALQERIARLVDQGVLTGGIFPSSLEERELKTLAEKKERVEEIPSLKTLENTKERLKSEPHFDLRTLLREQLA